MYARTPSVLFFTLLFTLGLAAGQAQSADTPAAPADASLRLQGRTELPGYTGDFDHFEVDLKGNRLFLAAEDHGTLEVFDLAAGKHLKTIEGFEVPHGILYLADKNRLIVTDSGAGMSKVLDATSYKIIDKIKLRPGADSMGYDDSSKRLYIATGGKDGNMADSFLSEIDPRTGKQYGDVKFDTNKIEAMAIEQNGNHLYLNVTGKNYMAVIDKKTHAVTATWPIKEAEQNAPVAFDEANRRLFVVTRKPGKLVILDAETGASITSFKAPERTDQVVFDNANHRIYVMGGEGYIGVFRQKDADHYEELARIPSASGAKTGLLVPELNRLYVAVSPGEGKTGAAVLQFAVVPN
jgi:DNA-binding beta-propeller fold protein YncE